MENNSFQMLIELSGLKRKFIAQKLNVSESMLSLQLKGKRKFKEEQKQKLKDMLLRYL